ncbi:MAG TPA: AAA family ATPase [Candidatus Paceibacterota bacterium]|nr:AAA family ATPase [Candidatus Paceibacterota bacterium]
MYFKRIKIQNIRSYENLDLNLNSGSLLLSGDIGSGKTSILIAIEFALFGLQPGQKGASLLKNGKDEGKVELEFEIDKNLYTIERTLKRKKTISQESVFITTNGNKEEKSINEAKSFILTILNYPSEFAKKTNLLYRFTVYTPQEEMKQIILEDSETRLNTLRHVFGIDKYKRIKENTLILTAKLREISRLKQGEILDLETKKETLKKRQDSLSLVKNQLPQIELDLSNALLARKRKEDEINLVKNSIEEKRNFEKELDKTSILLMTKNEQVTKLEKDMFVLKKRFEDASKSFSQKDLDEVLAKLAQKKKDYDFLNKEIIQISTKISGILIKKNEIEKLKQKMSSLKSCPTCLQEVNDMHKNNILSQAETEISQLNNEKINLDNEKQTKEISLKEIDIEIKKFEISRVSLETTKIKLQTIEEDHKKLDEIEKQKISLENDSKLLTEQINRLKELISDMKRFDSIMKARETELDEIIRKERQIEIKKAEIVKEIELGKKEILNLEKEIELKELAKNDLIYLTELEDWTSNKFLELIDFVEKNVMAKLKEEFSKLFNEWFSILVPDNFVVRLDEDFTPIIEQQDFQLDYDFLSGGERTAIALAYRLALNQTINSLLSEIKTKGLVILDEPTDGFSQQQLDKMRDVLSELDVNQLIIVSHDQKIESFVDNIIRLKKQEGISGLV